MISKQEIEKAKEFMKFYKNDCLNIEINNIENYETSNDGEFVYKNIEILLQYINQLEQENKKLNKKEFERKSNERINIQEIKYIDELEHGVMGTYIDENKRTINEVIKAVKQLDRQINLK